jgi:dipeptidase D
MTFVADLEPKVLWSHFDRILEIPRGSRNEAKIREYFISVAEKNGLTHKVDDIGNLVVRKPGTAGKEQSPTVILQGHLDMVNDKNSDVEFDFEKDALKPQMDGEYLKATGTTLGADNGIGLAAMLALMDADDLVHGPLEFLCTIDEETGLTGAAELGGDMLEGRCLINLDSEEEGVLTVGCAGGADTQVRLPLASKKAPSGAAAMKIKLAGLKGGHSGIDIHLQRGNAVKLLTRALYAASLEKPFLIADLAGGNKHNAIPREAFATIVLPGGAEDLKAVQAMLERELEAIKAEYKPAEPGMQFELEEAETPAEVWDDATTTAVLNLVAGLPHGVVAMSYDIAGLVETSTNLAIVNAEGGKLAIHMSSRSSVATALEGLRQRIGAIATMAGAEFEQEAGYPGWQPDLNSKVMEVVKGMHEEVLGSTPEIGAVHAGLECGIIGEKFPGMDMISFGPQIEFPHSPDERVKVKTVEGFYRLLTATLEKLA